MQYGTSGTCGTFHYYSIKNSYKYPYFISTKQSPQANNYLSF